MALADRHCVPCRGGTPPLTQPEVEPLLGELAEWRVEAGHLRREYRLKDFLAAVDFVNAITPVAEAEGHHPDLHVTWGKVGVELWTHKIDGLTESDFVMAAKIDRVFAQREAGAPVR